MDKQSLRMYRELYISELVNEGHKLERASQASRGPAVHEYETFRRVQRQISASRAEQSSAMLINPGRAANVMDV
jgi:hypothetical protein